MTIYAQPNLTSGIDDALITTSKSVPFFPIMILLFIFCVVFLGGSANQKRRIGKADYSFWAVLSGLTVSFVALLFTLGEGMINLTTLGIVIAITIFFGVWFFLSKIQGE
jgi:FtsH-binding integral membrane protein